MAATFNIKRCINEVEEIDSFTYSGGTGKRYALDIETSQLVRGIQPAPMTLTVEVTTYNFQNQSLTKAKKTQHTVFNERESDLALLQVGAVVNVQGLLNQERTGGGARALVRETFVVTKLSPTHVIANQDAYAHMAAVAAAAATTSTNRKNGGTHTTNQGGRDTTSA